MHCWLIAEMLDTVSIKKTPKITMGIESSFSYTFLQWFCFCSYRVQSTKKERQSGKKSLNETILMILPCQFTSTIIYP